jgi:hypothetical protein
MNLSRFSALTFLAVLVPAASIVATDPPTTKDDFQALFQQHPVEHPSLLLKMDDIERVKTLIQTRPIYKQAFVHLVKQANAIVEVPPVQREMRGKRMLFSSRRCLKRVTHTALAYHLTGNIKFAQAARDNMLAAAKFRNWNPSHFLDTGEMTAALGIGYDWLYSILSEEDRTTIRNAIVRKGLKTVRGGMWWLKADNNWCQVCNGGLAIGALAIREQEPELAAKTLERTLRLLPNAMEVYEPDGAFPEGPGYWKYGTAYNLLFLEALRGSLGTDAGLLERFLGFLKSGAYARHALGPSRYQFNYSDCSRDIEDDPNVCLFWFARELNQPTWIDYDLRILPEFFRQDHRSTSRKNRFFPMMFLWAPPENQAAQPLPLSWQGGGPTPVGFHRSSWDDESAVYVAIKGGRPSENHGHMDVGTFVIDAKGLRWAEDLGKESYTTMEKNGLNIWDRTQNSDRWKIYRYSNQGHNTLVVDGKHQRVAGHNPILRGQEQGPRRFTIIDMSPAYQGQLQQVHRGVRLDENGLITIRDEIKTDDEAEIRWGMITRATVTMLSPTLARLSQDGKEMYALLDAPDNVRWAEYSTKRNYEFNRSNEETTMLGFTAQVPADTEVTWSVTVHGTQPAEPAENQPLSTWGQEE